MELRIDSAACTIPVISQFGNGWRLEVRVLLRPTKIGHLPNQVYLPRAASAVVVAVHELRQVRSLGIKPVVRSHHEYGLIVPHRHADAVWAGKKGQSRHDVLVGIPDQTGRESSPGLDEQVNDALFPFRPRRDDEGMALKQPDSRDPQQDILARLEPEWPRQLD
ncbi:hypothetical protein CSUB01_12006 [Colletotrichum sublineola]|uniref:Uncharacterized protein n=1 Tax=Colletotrichum sublineola TaxID=1173701 RepID=A0A066X114_COLSU|nr:hypothetical protein CSUB01_12006 [Colletotrichum sublineola]